MFRKTIAIILTVFILIPAFTPAFAEDDFPCGGVIENVDVKILYSPLRSRIAYGDFGLSFSGMVLKITYPNGEHEIVKVKENSNTYYTAGDFSLNTCHLHKDEQGIGDYGFVRSYFSLYMELNHGGYSSYPEFIYFNIPTLYDIYNSISSLFTFDK